VYTLLICKQAGAADASAYQLTTHPNVKVDSQLRAAKNPAAKSLLSGLELSPTALSFGKEQCRLSIQAQEKEVKQAEVQAPTKVGTRADEITVTLFRDLIGIQTISCSLSTLLTYHSARLI
jgi:hypothetical protein